MTQLASFVDRRVMWMNFFLRMEVMMTWDCQILLRLTSMMVFTESSLPDSPTSRTNRSRSSTLPLANRHDVCWWGWEWGGREENDGKKEKRQRREGIGSGRSSEGEVRKEKGGCRYFL